MIVRLSGICFSCLAKFSSSFSHSPLKLILKQLFTSGSVNMLNIYLDFVSVNIQQYSLRLRRIIVKYKAILSVKQNLLFQYETEAIFLASYIVVGF